MTLAHSDTAKNAATNAVVDLLDAAGSKLVFRVGGTLGAPGTAAATLTFATPAFGASSAGTATARLDEVVSKAEFLPVKLISYGLAGGVLTAFLSAVIFKVVGNA